MTTSNGFYICHANVIFDIIVVSKCYNLAFPLQWFVLHLQGQYCVDSITPFFLSTIIKKRKKKKRFECCLNLAYAKTIADTCTESPWGVLRCGCRFFDRTM